MKALGIVVAAQTVIAAACAGQVDVGANATCEIVQASTPLPDGLGETSGLAISRRDSAVLWSHNDSGDEARIFAFRADGSPVGVVEVSGARNRDWEDIAAGPCDGGDCLFIADIGDNRAARDEVSIYRVAEPDPTSGTSEAAERFRITYPGGPRDAESVFVLPDGELYVLSKGRTSNVALYRYPQPLRLDEVVEMEHVVDLSAEKVDLAAQVTGADASPDGRWVAVRSYGALSVYRTADLLAGRPAMTIIDLAPLGESQGEAVAIDAGGRVKLTSEAGALRRNGTIAVLQCEYRAGEAGDATASDTTELED